MKSKKVLAAKQQTELINKLKTRFNENEKRHKGLVWAKVESRLKTNLDKLWSLNEMEKTGGEPDVVAFDKKTGEYVFFDCAAESPVGRRSVCYDRAGLESRKENQPAATALDLATTMGVELLTEKDYRALQKLGKFDLKTSSWIMTPAKIRSLGGALFADCRYDSVFVYHNGAQSYYAARAFRASLRV